MDALCCAADMNGGRVRPISCRCYNTFFGSSTRLIFNRHASMITTHDRVSASYDIPILTSAHAGMSTAISAVSGYDIAILSDLLHFQDSHGALVASLTSLLSKTRDARVYIAAGKYTLPHVCENFLRQAHQAGLVFEEGGVSFVTNGESGGGGVEVVEEAWLGKFPVSGLSESELAVRKAMCRWWVGQWADPTM
jgi:hypothetical protein